MSEDKKIAIIKELRGKPNYNEVVYKRVSKVMSRQTFFTLRDQLIMADKIMRKEWGRRVILHLPEDEESMKEFMKEQVARKHITLVGKDFKYESRKKHTEDLKKEVIEPWLNELPVISVAEGIRITISDSVDAPYGDSLPVEKETLFCDFKNHIRFSPNPFDELEKFKKKAKSFEERRYNLERKILTIIDAEMEFNAIYNNLENAISETEESKILKEFNEAINIAERLLNWVLEKLDAFYCIRWDEILFKKKFLNLIPTLEIEAISMNIILKNLSPSMVEGLKKRKKKKMNFKER